MTSPEALRQRITRISAMARLVTLLALIATPLVFAALVAAGRVTDLLPLPGGIVPDMAAASRAGSAAVVALAAVRPLAFLLALWLLDGLFQLYRQGAVFDAAATRRLWQLGWALIAIDLAEIVQRLIAGPLLSQLGLTEPFLSVGLGASMSIVGVFVIVIARIMELGRELQDFEEATI